MAITSQANFLLASLSARLYKLNPHLGIKGRGRIWSDSEMMEWLSFLEEYESSWFDCLNWDLFRSSSPSQGTGYDMCVEEY